MTKEATTLGINFSNTFIKEVDSMGNFSSYDDSIQPLYMPTRGNFKTSEEFLLRIDQDFVFLDMRLRHNDIHSLNDIVCSDIINILRAYGANKDTIGRIFRNFGGINTDFGILEEFIDSENVDKDLVDFFSRKNIKKRYSIYGVRQRNIKNPSLLDRILNCKERDSNANE